jgi:hypothetical protein
LNFSAAIAAGKSGMRSFCFSAKQSVRTSPSSGTPEIRLESGSFQHCDRGKVLKTTRAHQGAAFDWMLMLMALSFLRNDLARALISSSLMLS